MDFNKKFLFLYIYLALIGFSLTKDYHTFSNYEIVKKTKIELSFNVDFKNKIVDGIVKTYFTALKDGEVIVLDSKALKINSIIDCDTGEELEYLFDTQYEIDALGVPLKIYKNYNKDEEFAILIKFSTTKEGTSVSWFEPEQTLGKEYPFMYTQGESILNRELFPTQDTPAVKSPVSVSITVEKPLFAVNSGLYQGKIDNGETVTYFYEQKVPIPSYLVVIVAGAIEERVISDRTKVYGEKELVDLAVYEFEDTESYLEIAEAYVSPYLWGEYNILVLPPSYPFGGMENPTLTYVSASLLAGDKSLSVIAHEICHSWSGNLVTNNNWVDFWLNEGFTVFLQIKMFGLVFNDLDLKNLLSMTFEEQLNGEIIYYGESKSFTQLRPYIMGRNPDDSFNTVPYLKGCDFLLYLENITNSESEIDLFRKILRQYFDKFKYVSISSEDFKQFFIDKIKEELPDKSSEILEKIDWVKWVEAPGYPPVRFDYSNKYEELIGGYASLFYEKNLPENFIDTFKGWSNLLQTYFLGKIGDKVLDDDHLSYLTYTLNLKEGYNVEITCSYLIIVLSNVKTIEGDVKETLDSFLGKHGRINYLRPLYTLYIKIDKPAAVATFEKNRNFYHHMIIKAVESLIRTL